MKKGCVCIIDTGVNPHLDLVVPRNRIRSFIDNVNGRIIPYDDNGHGTFLAGVIAGNGLLSGHKICGIGYDSDIVVIKAIPSSGKATYSEIIRATEDMLSMKDKYNIDVLLLGFGARKVGNEEDRLEKMMHRVVAHGIIPICAVGNSGADGINSPASSPYAIAVGSIDPHYHRSSFSSYGTINGIMKPDYYAIGEDVIGLDSIGYTYMSGTSVSTPYVASIVGRIMREYEGVNITNIRRILDELAINVDGKKIL